MTHPRKQIPLPILSSRSSINGKGKRSPTVWELTTPKSTHNPQDPPLFRTKTMGLANADWLSRTTSPAARSFTISRLRPLFTTKSSRSPIPSAALLTRDNHPSLETNAGKYDKSPNSPFLRSSGTSTGSSELSGTTLNTRPTVLRTTRALVQSAIVTSSE